MKGSSTSRVFARFALFGAATVIAGVIVEIALRLVGFAYPHFFDADDLTGLSHRPGIKGQYVTEGNAFVEIDSRGLRGSGHQIQKPDGTFRIAILGDSFAEAMQVPMQDTFASHVERAMSAGCSAVADKSVEVVNFGVSSFGTAQELLTFRERARAYSPDLVILAFFSGNDVRNNARDLEHDDPLRPFFQIDERRHLVPDNSFRDAPAFQVRRSVWRRWARDAADHLRSLQLLRMARYGLSADRRAAAGIAQQAIDDLVYVPPSREDWRKAWDVTEVLIETLDRDVSESGGQLLVVTLSNPMQVHPDPSHRERFQASLGVTDLFYPERRLAELATRSRIDLLSLAEPMQLEATKTGVYFHGFSETGLGTGHWNEHGHRFAGEAMATRLCGMIDGRGGM